MSPETNKLLSSPRAFLRHLKSASCPLVVWHSTKLSIIMTAKVVVVASCNCNGDFGKGWCTCRKSNVLNTGLCSCGDKWQNTDASPPTLALNVNNDYEKLWEPDDCTEK